MVRQQVDEIMLLKLVQTYCLPCLLYSCEIWPREALDMKEVNVMWNNGFRHIFTARQHSLLCLSAVLAIVNLSDRPSDRPSHAGIKPKRLRLRSRGLHCRISP